VKALYEDIASKKGNESFLGYSFTVPFFEFKWHYHPEYELTLITRGTGKRLVGDCYESFEAGDLVLLGPDLPHTWSSDKVKKKNVSAVVIQFSEDFIKSFLTLPEFEKIASLLSSADRGLFFPESNLLQEEIEVLTERSGVEKVTALLSYPAKAYYARSIKNSLPNTLLRLKVKKQKTGSTRYASIFKRMLQKILRLNRSLPLSIFPAARSVNSLSALQVKRSPIM
jgi:hypothetical protein